MQSSPSVHSAQFEVHSSPLEALQPVPAVYWQHWMPQVCLATAGLLAGKRATLALKVFKEGRPDTKVPTAEFTGGNAIAGKLHVVIALLLLCAFAGCVTGALG